jgi:hypothetical protein
LSIPISWCGLCRIGAGVDLHDRAMQHTASGQSSTTECVLAVSSFEWYIVRVACMAGMAAIGQRIDEFVQSQVPCAVSNACSAPASGIGVQS